MFHYNMPISIYIVPIQKWDIENIRGKAIMAIRVEWYYGIVSTQQ